MVSDKQEDKIVQNTDSANKLIRYAGREQHSRPTLLSDFILGSQDGLVNVLGILLGLTAANTSIRVFFIAAFAALGTESISMGAVAYTSTSARRKVYRKEVNREKQEMKNVPKIKRNNNATILFFICDSSCREPLKPSKTSIYDGNK